MTRYPAARASLSSGLAGSVTITMRWVGSMPAWVNAASKARRWESVSTVEPDLLETTTTARSSRSARAVRTESGFEESSTVSSTPAVAQMTSGASDDPPIPHRTTWSTPRSARWPRKAATSPIRGRELRPRLTQERRVAASGSASGPHSVASLAKSLLAKRSATSCGTCRPAASAAGPDASTPRATLVIGRPW